MILGRSFADFVLSLRGEFDVVGLLGMTEDDAVKTAVIFKFRKHSEPKALRIHRSDCRQVIGWPGYTQLRKIVHYLVSD